jgi:hypothetical protein
VCDIANTFQRSRDRLQWSPDRLGYTYGYSIAIAGCTMPGIDVRMGSYGDRGGTGSGNDRYGK